MKQSSRPDTVESQGLATLFTMGRDCNCSSDEELRDSLEHLLGLPVDLAINQMPARDAEKLRKRAEELAIYADAAWSGTPTLTSLLGNKGSDLAKIEFVKKFGKILCGKTTCAWPRKVGEVVYYASYAVARLHQANNLGRLTESDLQHAFQKLASLAWIDVQTRQLFRDAQAVNQNSGLAV